MNRDQPYQPSRRAQLEIPAEFTEPAVKAWLAGLPMADTDRASDILLHGLRVLSRTAGLSPRARVAQLEGIRATLLALLDPAEPVSSSQEDATFPLREAQDNRAHRAYNLCIELARAYESLAMAPDQSDRLGATLGLRALVLHRAMEGYGQALLQLLENYQSTPARYWRTTYDLYREAVKYHVDQERLAGETVCETIYAQFMRIILLSQANLYRFRPRDMRQAYIVLGAMSEKAELSDSPVRDNQRASFYLDLAVDAPPQAIQSLHGQGPVERRYVMTQLLVKWAAKYYADAGNRRIGASRLSKTVLSQLLKSLSLPDRRRSKRVLDTGEYHIHLGIAALTNRLSGHSHLELKPLATAEHVYLSDGDWLKIPGYTLQEIDYNEAEIPGEKRFARDDRQVGWLLGNAKEAVKDSDIWPTVVTHGAENSTDYAPQLDVWLLNSSAQGYCLLWTDKSISAARVGELVGVEKAGADLHLGVVRWMNHDKSGDLMLGIELLSPHVEGGLVRPLNRATAGEKALYVSAVSRLGQPAMVLTPPGHFDTGLVIEWSGERGKRVLRLDGVQSATPAYTAYIVTAVARNSVISANQSA